MDLGKLLREAKRRGRVNVNVARKTNIKVARNVAKGNGTAVASARQDVEINQRHGDKPSDDAHND
jgi:hypothetical protein